MNRRLTATLVIALFVIVGLAEHTYAYIDAGTGSYLLQVLFAGLFGMIISAKSLWAKVRASFRASSHDDRR
jgi:hypothetical protein